MPHTKKLRILVRECSQTQHIWPTAFWVSSGLLHWPTCFSNLQWHNCGSRWKSTEKINKTVPAVCNNYFPEEICILHSPAKMVWKIQTQRKEHVHKTKLICSTQWIGKAAQILPSSMLRCMASLARFGTLSITSRPSLISPLPSSQHVSSSCNDKQKKQLSITYLYTSMTDNWKVVLTTQKSFLTHKIFLNTLLCQWHDSILCFYHDQFFKEQPKLSVNHF